MNKLYGNILKINIKYFVIIIMIFIVFAMNTICSANNENLITEDFELYSRSEELNGEITYGSLIKVGEEYKGLLIKATDFNLPSNLYNYKDDIRLRITYSQVDYEVLECKVINYKTGEIVEDTSEENINRLFNIEYGKTIIENSWVDEIKLSTLKENEVYKYTASATVQFPKIKNDVGENCIIYIKQWHDETYKKEVNMYNEISGTTISGSFNEYKAGDTFYIMYKKASTKELLKLIEQDKIVYLSKYNDGDTLEYQFEEYIYNDTQNDITINIKNTIMGVEETDSIIIEKGQIYGFSWMIDSASISYTNDINNENNNNEEHNGKTEGENKKNETVTIEQTKKDNTQTNEKLPQTGVNQVILTAIIFSTIIVTICYKKYHKIRDNNTK